MFASLVLLAWTPIVLVIYCALPPWRAALVSLVGGCLFLPQTTFEVGGLPEYTKIAAVAFPVLLATALFVPERLLYLRWTWLDVPMAAWCLAPLASSLANRLGVYDGFSAVCEQVLNWGLPYLVGRVYLNDLPALRDLAIALCIGGLLYVPFCLWEIRMSPHLGVLVYGVGQNRGVAYLDELGSWGSRPNVFMGNALATGMFMTSATLCGIWLWRSGSWKRILTIGVGGPIVVLLAVTLLCKNMGALALLAAGLGTLLVAKWLHVRLAAFVLIALMPAYMLSRATGRFSGQSMADAAAVVHPTRAESLEFRLVNEDRLIAKALKQPIFGWGRWGRARVFREDGTDISVTDGLWVITLGNAGIVGLTALTVAMLLPAGIVLARLPARLWAHPATAPLAALAVLVVLYALDNLMNDMPSALFTLTLGGLVNAGRILRYLPEPRHAAVPARVRPARTAIA